MQSQFLNIPFQLTIQIHPDGSKSFEGTTIVSGNVETLVEVHCPLKTSKQKRSVRNTGNILFVEVFDVSVSYNREDFSDPERVILMNSKCQQNNGTTTDPNFVLKVTHNFILLLSCLNLSYVNISCR